MVYWSNFAIKFPNLYSKVIHELISQEIFLAIRYFFHLPVRNSIIFLLLIKMLKRMEASLNLLSGFEIFLQKTSLGFWVTAKRLHLIIP